MSMYDSKCMLHVMVVTQVVPETLLLFHCSSRLTLLTPLPPCSLHAVMKFLLCYSHATNRTTQINK